MGMTLSSSLLILSSFWLSPVKLFLMVVVVLLSFLFLLIKRNKSYCCVCARAGVYVRVYACVRACARARARVCKRDNRGKVL